MDATSVFFFLSMRALYPFLSTPRHGHALGALWLALVSSPKRGESLDLFYEPSPEAKDPLAQ